ncbi:MAG: carboxyl-terminal processing protease [Cellvibrionaceae bacterium]|jgi:carboxyl-terminal processing protease
MTDLINDQPNQSPTLKQRAADYLITIVLIIITFSLGYAAGQSRWAPVRMLGLASQTPAEAQQAFTSFWEVWDLLNHNSLDRPLDPTILVQGAIDGMLATLDDPHTAYLPPAQQTAMEDSIQGELQGIGAEVESVEGAITIVSPYDGSPAAEAGLRPGDIIREADGTDLSGMDIGEAAALVRGEAGTDVNLVIERDGERFPLTITRGIINLPSVLGEMLTGDAAGIAYIRINRFGGKTASELDALLAETIVFNPAGIVLDLRRNPGGSLTTVVEVADHFLPKSVILSEDFGNGESEVFEATDAGQLEVGKLIVLIDGGSASAAEVLAGAIRDNGRGVLLGTTSFGKGTVQNWFSLRDGSGVRITTARWLTPDETWVHKTGLTPDIIVEPFEGFVQPLENDAQFDEAIDYLLGR